MMRAVRLVVCALILLCAGFPKVYPDPKQGDSAAVRAVASSGVKNATWLPYNPHVAMFRDSKSDYDACLFCHSAIPDSNPGTSGAVKFLNLGGSGLCEGCHGNVPHSGVIEHRGKLSDAAKKRVGEWEAVSKKSLPLGTGGEVICSSCHDPHPVGVLNSLDSQLYGNIHVYKKEGKPVGAALELAKANDARIKSSAAKKWERSTVNGIELPFRENPYDGTLCKICHDPK